MVKPIQIGKLDAARRQLETAIVLWFKDGDPVAIHTLAFAAYEIIHAVSKKRNPNRRDLLFDMLVIKDEYRSEFNIWLKKTANFFKHGDRDGEAIVEFYPELTALFLMFAILGLEMSGERNGLPEKTFLWWILINRPEWLTEKGAIRVRSRARSIVLWAAAVLVMAGSIVFLNRTGFCYSQMRFLSERELEDGALMRVGGRIRALSAGAAEDFQYSSIRDDNAECYRLSWQDAAAPYSDGLISRSLGIYYVVVNVTYRHPDKPNSWFESMVAVNACGRAVESFTSRNAVAPQERRPQP